MQALQWSSAALTIYLGWGVAITCFWLDRDKYASCFSYVKWLEPRLTICRLRSILSWVKRKNLSSSRMNQYALGLSFHSNTECTLQSYRRQRGAGRGRGLPWIFIHGTDIGDKGLIVLFSVLFCYFSVFFSLAPSPGNFSADALDYSLHAFCQAGLPPRKYCLVSDLL